MVIITTFGLYLLLELVFTIIMYSIMSLHVRSGKVGAPQNRFNHTLRDSVALTEDRSQSVYMLGHNLVCPVVFLCAGLLVVFFVFVVFSGMGGCFLFWGGFEVVGLGGLRMGCCVGGLA